MRITCIKQHLSNIWSWIHEKVKQNWGRVEKALPIKKNYLSFKFSEGLNSYFLEFLWFVVSKNVPANQNMFKVATEGLLQLMLCVFIIIFVHIFEVCDGAYFH